ncbi:MAG: hypothetical protein ACOYMM_11430 [Phycisphaerales bacterium]
MSGADEAAAALLEATLRRVKPSKVVCIEAEGGARVPVAVGTGKGARFRHTASMIVSRLHEWSRVDLLNARGEVMESWAPPTPAGADDAVSELAPELAAMPPGQDERVLAFGAALLGLVQRAVDHATDRHTASMRVANEGLALLLKSQSERLAVVEKQQTGMLKLAYDAVRVSAYHEGRAELGREVAQLQARVDGAAADDPMQGMAQALMQRALGIGAAPAAPATTPTEPTG